MQASAAQSSIGAVPPLPLRTLGSQRASGFFREPPAHVAPTLAANTTAQDGFYGILGQSPVMRALFQTLQRLGDSTVPVLVEGESGTGKELVARALHWSSSRSGRPFIAVNCGALERALARSELFGHAKGSFTGAAVASAGVFEQVQGGTLFLDEIGELPIEVQPILLRTLECNTVTRVGESQERVICARLVAATNRDLVREVEAGRFRQDLYYRLNVVKVDVPPLRSRRSDIRGLASNFARECGLEELPNEVVEEIELRDWPGNVRELRNAIRCYATIGKLPSRTTSVKAIPTDFLRQWVDIQRPYHELKLDIVQQFAEAYLSVLLEHTMGNQSAAARISGLERSYLSKMLGRLKHRAK